MSDKQTYRIPISNGIFEHCSVIGESIWYFLWCIDKTTKEVKDEDGNRFGKVLGGKPCRDEDVSLDLGVSKWTIARWRDKLTEHEYIKTKRTPVGYSVEVLKSKKWVDPNGK